ncbi:VOC family protein [Paenibacillus paeoniae]|uniref:VOC domain-containing protein n=1 Tax=Paenibacillus paeoniae TaxID=2292705 RepID=A0A371PLF0_9BACL|nr:hypothetical protein [Paenibacillus paeoniae]REK77028.1 hypothetical protein DX130_08460 [Paenibacillus paeoniae]
MKIREVILQTSELDQQYQFYHVRIGLPIVAYTEKLLRIQCGDSILTFEAYNGDEMPYYHFAFNISPHKFDLAISHLRERGIQLNLVNGREIVHSNSWNSDSIYFYDPAGNIVEYIARQKLAGVSEVAFEGNVLLNITEIGMAVTNVTDTADELQDLLKEQIYLNADSLFAPIGDEYGLLILSSTERQWLGSTKPVRVFPLQVVIEGLHESVHQVRGLPYQIHSTSNT